MKTNWIKHRQWRGLGAVAALAMPLWLGSPSAALAHPHVWVTVKTDVLFDGAGRISGFRHRWTFDEFYSAFAVQGMDKNGDGKFDRAELEPLAKVNIESLSEFGYFTFAWLGKEALERGEPQDYALEYRDGMLMLDFTLPLVKAVAAAQAPAFHFSVYDPTYYVAFSFAKDTPVQLARNAPDGCISHIAAPEPQQVETKRLGEAFFDQLDPAEDWGAQFASRVTVQCGKQ